LCGQCGGVRAWKHDDYGYGTCPHGHGKSLDPTGRPTDDTYDDVLGTGERRRRTQELLDEAGKVSGLELFPLMSALTCRFSTIRHTRALTRASSSLTLAVAYYGW